MLLNSDHSPGSYELMDLAEEAEQSYRAECEVRLIELRELNLQQTDQALERLRQGTYGICEVCGQAIGEKRLEVRPTATLCLACQSTRESVGMRGAAAALS
jgi:DnaK suppressor protein